MRRQELESVDFYIAQGYADIAIDTLDLLAREGGPHAEFELSRHQRRLRNALQSGHGVQRNGVVRGRTRGIPDCCKPVGSGRRHAALLAMLQPSGSLFHADGSAGVGGEVVYKSLEPTCYQ